VTDRPLVLEDGKGSDWARIRASLRGVANNPFWRFEDRYYVVAPGVSVRREPGWIDGTIVYNSERGTPAFYTSDVYELLEPLLQGPRRVVDLVSELGRRGFTVDEQQLTGFLERAVGESVLLAGNLPGCRAQFRPRSVRRVEAAPRTAADIPYPSAPFNVNFYMTFDCNLDCKHCGIDRRPVDGHLPYHRLRRLFDQLERAGIHNLVLNGGEPLCHPDAAQVIDDLADRPFRTLLFTNGTLIDEELCEAFSRSERFLLSISLDGATAEVHDDFRGRPGTFDRVMRTARLLSTHSPATPRIFACVMHRRSVDQLEDVVRLAESLGMNGVGFLQMNYMGRARETGYYVSLAERQDVLDRVLNLGEAYQSRLAVTVQGREPTLKRDMPPLEPYFGSDLVCACGVVDMALAPDGECFHCESAFSLPPAVRRQFSCGRAVDDLWGAWQGEAWAVMRGGLTPQETGACVTCRLYGSCSMKRCRIYSLVSGGDLRDCPAECRRLAAELGVEHGPACI